MKSSDTARPSRDPKGTRSDDEKNLILIGYRGTGKTTVAQILAKRLGWDWLDADAYLAAKYQRTIRQIFAEEGEAGFRAMESAVLAELRERRRTVLAAGGGVVCSLANQTLIRELGEVVWLTADAETIAQRLHHDSATPEQRPALTDLSGLEEIKQLLAVREPMYRQCADLTVNTMARTPEEVAESILQQLKRRMEE